MISAVRRWFGSCSAQTTIPRCSDCNVAEGELHALFCTKEPCPFCTGQLAACGCIFRVLDLNDAERESVEQYLEEADKPLGFLKECLNLKGIDELDYMTCTGVLCSAVMIDAILNGATKDLPESAIVWLEEDKKLKVQKLLPAAIEGLDRILGDKSEMNETWAEEPEHYRKWKKHFSSIKKRLSQSLEASQE